MHPALTSAPTHHAVETYMPKERRQGVALCLSGGGFRAALFHLGALRRLNELGVLSRVDTISSVSGGSILAALLASRVPRWPDPGDLVQGWDRRVARPFHALVSRNLRTLPLARYYLLPWNWLREEVATLGLEAQYRRRVTQLSLDQLPDRPRYIFSATDMAYGVNWVFERQRMGDYQAGYSHAVAGFPLARAVAASSCFPPVFPPMAPGLEPGDLRGGEVEREARKHPDPATQLELLQERQRLIEGLRLTDGGVYDNLGLEPVWKDHAVVLVSDGGATFDPEWDRKHLLWRLQRYTSIVGRSAGAVRKRWLIAGYIRGSMAGAYWGIGSAVESYDLPGGYPRWLVDQVISEVRTDLDAFSPSEVVVLENHGYLLADAAIRKHAASSFPLRDVPASVPHPEWMDADRVQRELTGSHRVTWLGRWGWRALSQRDSRRVR